jgi:hypothetical protein
MKEKRLRVESGFMRSLRVNRGFDFILSPIDSGKFDLLVFQIVLDKAQRILDFRNNIVCL